MFGALAASTLFIAGTVIAQEFQPWSVSLGTPTYQQADFTDINGHMKVTRAGLDLSYTKLAGGAWTFQAGIEQSRYSGRVSGVASTDSASDARDISVGATYFKGGNPWSWYLTANTHDSVAEDADSGTGGYSEFGGGLLRAVSDKLVLGLAVAGRVEIEKDTSYAVVPYIEYNINDHSRIGSVRSTDPSIGYTYVISNNYEFYVVAHGAQRQYRLDKNTAVVDLEDGLRIGTTYHNQSGLTLEAFIGSVKRTLEYDRNGARLVDTDLDSTTFAGLGVSNRF